MIGTMNCIYETPCGWCSKLDKKCDKKAPERWQRAKCNLIEDISSIATHSAKVTAPDWFTGGDRGDILG